MHGFDADDTQFVIDALGEATRECLAVAHLEHREDVAQIVADVSVGDLEVLRRVDAFNCSLGLTLYGDAIAHRCWLHFQRDHPEVTRGDTHGAGVAARVRAFSAERGVQIAS